MHVDIAVHTWCKSVGEGEIAKWSELNLILSYREPPESGEMAEFHQTWLYTYLYVIF